MFGSIDLLAPVTLIFQGIAKGVYSFYQPISSLIKSKTFKCKIFLNKLCWSAKSLVLAPFRYVGKIFTYSANCLQLLTFDDSYKSQRNKLRERRIIDGF